MWYVPLITAVTHRHLYLPSKDKACEALSITPLVILLSGEKARLLGRTDCNVSQPLQSDHSIFSFISSFTLSRINIRIRAKNAGRPISNTVVKTLRFCTRKFFHKSKRKCLPFLPILMTNHKFFNYFFLELNH